MEEITLRKGKLDDLAELQQLVVDTVNSVCRKDYNQRQIEAWVSGIENVERWRKILISQFVLVALYKNKMVGFISLAHENLIDMLYVHRDFQRHGIARKLYVEIEREAERQKQIELTSDISKTAKPFFEKMGFNIVKKQRIPRRGVEIINFKMLKSLG